jgi:Domain of unknown function (DUF1844)
MSETQPGERDDQAAQEEALRQLREELAAAPAGDVVAQAAAHLATFAYVRLGIPPEQYERFRDLAAARVLIDAFGGLIEGVRGRLGEGEHELQQALAALRMTYAQLVAGAAPAASGAGPEAAAGQPAPGDEGSRLHRPPSGLWVPGQD